MNSQQEGVESSSDTGGEVQQKIEVNEGTTISFNTSKDVTTGGVSLLGESKRLTTTLLRAVFFSSVGGILFGYDLGVISGALPQIAATFYLTESQQESVVSFLYVGGIVGAAVGGFVCDRFGRKFAILTTDLLFAGGALILYYSPSYTTVLWGRLVVGFAVAVSGCADVSYLSEISPLQYRGSIVSRNEACITLGFLLAYASGYGFTILDPYDGWRYMFGISSIVALIQFLGMVSLPESPIWLASHNRVEEAKVALFRIYEFNSLDDLNHYYNTEFQCIMASEQTGHTPTNDNKRSDKIQQEVVNNPYSLTEEGHYCSHNIEQQAEERESKRWLLLFRQSIIAVFLSIAQQFCGHSNVLNFAPIIFATAGMGQQSSLASTVLVGSVKFLVTIFVIWKIDVVGRRHLLLFGIGLIQISLLCMIVAFTGSRDATANETTLVGGGSTVLLAVIGAIGMATGYAASFGPLTWLITSEMFPSSLRGRALGASTVLNNISASLVSYTFLSVSTHFGTAAAPFVVYSLVTLVTLIFTIVAIPDTGFKSPTDIHRDIQYMPFWAFLGKISGRSFSKHAADIAAAAKPNYTEMNELKATLI
jgi:MFS family permease